MLELILQGGMFMVPLLLCSVAGLAVIVERWLYLTNAEREARFVLTAVDRLAEARDIDGVERFCEGRRSYLTEIFRSATRKYKQLQEEPNLDFVQQEISKVMEDASIANTIDLERRLSVLGSVGNVAPLFGFAGTVTGMIAAFKAIAMSANPNAQTVASGIQEALVTTAAGLLIAIPAVLAYNHFTDRIDSLNARTEESANGMLDMLVMNLVRLRRDRRSA